MSTEEILSRSVKITELPDNYEKNDIIETLAPIGEVVDSKCGKNEMLITFSNKEEKEASIFFDGNPIKNYVLHIEPNPTTLTVFTGIVEPVAIEKAIEKIEKIEEKIEKKIEKIEKIEEIEKLEKKLEKQIEKAEEPVQYQKLDDIPMTSSSYDYSSELGFGLKKERNSFELSKKKDFEIDQSNFLVCNVLYSEVVTLESTGSYKKTVVIAEDPNEVFEASQVKETKLAERAAAKSEEKAVKHLQRTIEAINVPFRPQLPSDDKFYKVVNKSYLLVFTATWAFVWFIASM